MKTNELKKCPKCECGIRTIWVENRKLRQECNGTDEEYGCGWKGKPYTPPKKRIQSVKSICVNQFGGWGYEAFDQYGHTYTISHTYYDENECKEAAQKCVDDMCTYPNFGKCTAVIWPEMVKVKGIVIHSKNRNK